MAKKSLAKTPLLKIQTLILVQLQGLLNSSNRSFIFTVCLLLICKFCAFYSLQKPNLILNVDGLIGVAFVDLLRNCGSFTR